MRFVVPALAALIAVASTPLAAQQIGAPLTTQPAAQKAGKPAKPAKGAVKAKPGAPAQASAAGSRQPKWEDAPMPKPLPEKDSSFSWPSGGVRPTVGNGGGGMAIGF
ncbi:hypothetical protein SLNSH_09420 [Alsobacter soli]|uniref:Translation initiation factor IF-2 n=1 Tax=Alsobacter soli TaxID=2109933 RepID=A0A2T1HUT8_9HYPH|nr:hypothetical protein [Alsobacter soli]PSC05404.1 hypothetical protein SLNSH_09420 [Alsobacter soli]